MNVKDIILANLQQVGADGLCNPEESCGCGIDDLQPCDGFQKGCRPAQQRVATEPGEYHDVGDRVFFVMEGQ